MNDLHAERLKLGELAARIREATSRPDERPAFVHWSDAQMLFEVIRTLEAHDARQYALNRALTAVIPFLKPVGDLK